MSSAKPTHSAAEAQHVAALDLEDAPAMTEGPFETWRLAAICEWERQLDLAVQEWDEAALDAPA
jgi:hypothetical protein